MNNWVVETPTFEEDLMNNRVVMLNQVGVNRVVEIIKEKDKEIERQDNVIKEVRTLADKYELGKYDYSVPCFELKEILDKENDYE